MNERLVSSGPPGEADAPSDPPPPAALRRFQKQLVLGAAGLAAVLLGALLGVGARPPALVADATTGPTLAETPLPTSSPPPVVTPAPTLPPPTGPTATRAPKPTRGPSTPAPTEPVGVAPVQLPLGLRAMALTDGLRIRTRHNLDTGTRLALLDVGTTFTLVKGPVFASGYWWYRVNDVSIPLDDGATGGWVASADHDGSPWIGATPRSCEGWTFADAAITIDSFADLEAGFVGTWMGCVTTPWVPPQWVTLTFRSDGTYASAVLPHPEAGGNPAFYYGTDGDSPTRRYRVTDLLDSLVGAGEIDIVFDDGSGSIVRDELRNLRLMGDRLDFELFHLEQYGPVSFQLYRIIPA